MNGKRIFIFCIIYYGIPIFTVCKDSLKFEKTVLDSDFNESLNNGLNKYKYVDIKTINFNELVKIKSVTADIRFERTVYYDKEKNIYIKIWSKQYTDCPHFLNAAKSGFYDDISTLETILLDEEKICRGYIAAAINQINNNLILKTKILDSTDNQNENYKKFMDLLKEKTIKHKIIYFNLVHDNLAFNGHRYFIVDLEGVRDFNNFKLFYDQLNPIFSYNPSDYILFIESLLKKENL